ncbi:putative ATPase [Amycolatopsis endophytica]|uniref:Putative ATPase n=1 Tax=Amycolatopsis endophytica TaxID=860233 RepID=A0A853B1Q1_9PSEU|nr:BTAD domain-containing putative transcriptional regulator [Amycolatopsis endophytica]NYI89043.1 putative ATPase [Amycolatopsis endophytica]
MRVTLLGPVRAQADDGTPIDIGGARLRMLLARLALDCGRPVGTDALIDGLWGAESPADAANALQSLVSRLRRTLGGAAMISSASGGYTLDAEVDARRFEELSARGRRELVAGRCGEAAALLTEALALWRGDALADVRDAPFAQAPATRLEDLRFAALEDRFDAELALGRHADVLADLEAAGEAHPLRERLAALRMRALSAAGRQADALALFERTRATLADELGVDPSAELRDAHLAVLRGETAPPRAESVLPVRLTSFVGRDRELERVAQALSSSRLVTLVGPGGAGKTRLATEAAERHPGRAWFVALAGVRDAGDVAGAILGALGSLDFHMANARVPPPDALGRVVELLGGESLLVLDNCEHVVDTVADVAFELLARVPGLRILATSREPLAITGESLCPVGPLEVAEAVRLFTDRALAVRPGFTLDGSTSDAVAEICERLDGMPLALELAAAKLRSMTAEQIARKLDDRFRLLSSGSRTAMPRQRTLRAVVEWSWDLLEKPERILARRLAVFTGGATVAAAEAVCADELLPAEDVLYVLGSLVEKSIVDAVSAGGEPRYRMLETIRVYGAERLDEAGERDEVAQRFTAYFLALAEENEPRIRTGDQLHAIEVFAVEQDNLMTALRGALDARDAVTASRLILADLWYWVIRSYHREPAPLLEEVLSLGDALPADVRACLNLMYTIMSSVPLVRRPDLASVVDECERTGALERFPMLALAVPMVCFLGGEVELAKEKIERTLRHSDPWAAACARWAEGFMADQNGDLVRGERARELALAGFRECGDRWGTAMTLSMQAESRSLRGDHAAAIAGFEEGLAMARELASTEDTVQQLTQLADERMRIGDTEGAWRDVTEADRVAGDKIDQRAMVALRRCDLARRSGNFALAHEELDWLRDNTPRIPFPVDMAGELIAVKGASLLASEGRPAEAWPLLPRALRSSAERRDLPDVANMTAVVARVFHAEGDPERAAWALGLTEAVRRVFDRGDPELRAMIASLRAELGDDAYEAAYQRGSALTTDEAIEAVKAAIADRAR